MRRCKIIFYGQVEIKYDNTERESIDALIESIEDGNAPTWFEQLLVGTIPKGNFEIEEVKFLDQEPEPEEPLDFDY
jgi:hypothetical protein